MPSNDSDSDSDADDRTPLVNPASRVTQGGTFNEQSENPFQRAARSISQQMDNVSFYTASGVHSINAEQVDTSSYADSSSESLISERNLRGQACEGGDEIHTHVRPSTSNDDKSDILL